MIYFLINNFKKIKSATPSYKILVWFLIINQIYLVEIFKTKFINILIIKIVLIMIKSGKVLSFLIFNVDI